MNRSEMLSFNMNFEYKVPDKLQIWCTGEAKYTYYSITRSNFPLWNFKAAAGVYVTLFKRQLLELLEIFVLCQRLYNIQNLNISQQLL